MDRRIFLMLSAVLPLVSACGDDAPSTAAAPAKTFADLASHPGSPLVNRGLVAVALPPKSAQETATLFAVKCAACGGDHFDVRERLSMKRGGDTSPRGINLVCHECQLRTVLFDATRDGYGGKLGHNSALADERPLEQALRDADGNPLINRQIRYACRYNLSPEEIFQMAEAEGLHPAELFDVFVVETGDGKDGWQQVWNYRCA